MGNEYSNISKSNTSSEYEIINFTKNFEVFSKIVRKFDPNYDYILKEPSDKKAVIDRISYNDIKYINAANNSILVDISTERATGIARELSPGWLLTKDNCNSAYYIEQYIETLNDVLPSTWHWLWEQAIGANQLYLVCLCPPVGFCHTYIALAYIEYTMPTHFEINVLPSWAKNIFK